MNNGLKGQDYEQRYFHAKGRGQAVTTFSAWEKGRHSQVDEYGTDCERARLSSVRQELSMEGRYKTGSESQKKLKLYVPGSGGPDLEDRSQRH